MTTGVPLATKLSRRLSSTATALRSKFIEKPSEIEPLPNGSLAGKNGIVYIAYDINQPPPRPERPHTRFVLISDTHNHNCPLPDGDALLHAGDLTNKGTLADFRKTMEWITNVPHPVKIIIAGNHDITLHQKGGWYDERYARWHTGTGKQSYEDIMELLKGAAAIENGVVYLEDEACTFQRTPESKKWTVFGSPPEFGGWAFNYTETEAPGIVDTIQPSEILITHGPPLGVLDKTLIGENTGCPVLLDRVRRKLRPKLHVFGHIHEARGALIHKYRSHETIFANAANLPLGMKAWSEGKPVPVGGPGWQPIIADMFEDV